MAGFLGREELQCIQESMLGQLELLWKRTLEPWRRKHKSISLLVHSKDSRVL